MRIEEPVSDVSFAISYAESLVDEVKGMGFIPEAWKIDRKTLNIIGGGGRFDDHFPYFVGLPVVSVSDGDNYKMTLIYSTPPLNQQLLHYAKVRGVDEERVRGWGRALKAVISALTGKGIIRSKQELDLVVAMERVTR